MRRSTPGILVVLLALVAALLPFAPLGLAPAAAAAGAPKVVVIVGPAGSATARYRADADEIAAVAARYTPNVVKVYTPNATWSAAKAALQGASIVVYMGHGNGFPSPYRTTPWPYSQNGLGLNPVAGVDDTTTQYYGEYYLARDIRLAPNAFVLLAHLCYASGNSEPGRAEPTLSVAQQRVDNFAAGWLRTGAGAVLASAHYGGAGYIESLFTRDMTIDEMWRTGPGATGTVISFASARTAGATVQMDPDDSGRYLRALTGSLDLRTAQVTGAVAVSEPGAAPGTGPALSLAVPGDASVAVDGAGLYADPLLTPDALTGGAPWTLAAGTVVRLQATAGTATDGSAVYFVTTSDQTRAGFMSARALRPASGAPAPGTGPRVVAVDDGPGIFSPNGDGRNDTFRLSGDLDAAGSWRVTFSTSGGATLASVAGVGSRFDASWDGTSGGARVADGTYRWQVVARDAAGVAGPARSGVVTLDTVAPTLAVVSLASVTPTTFSPNGDGIADKVTVDYTMSETGFADLSVASASGVPVRAASATAAAGKGRVAWDGTADGGGTVADGPYTLTVTPRDAAGNVGAPYTRPVAVYNAVSAVRASAPVFFPQAADGGAPTTLSFSLLAPATVTWTVSDSAGRTVRTQFLNQALAPGTYAFEWDGRDAAGAVVPRGTYYSNIRATDGTLALRTRLPVVADAFSVKVSDTTPSRGQSITVTAVSAEPLGAAPRVTVAQTGVRAWSVAMARSGSGWKATIRLKAGSRGTVSFTVRGRDLGGTTNATKVSYRLG